MKKCFHPLWFILILLSYHTSEGLARVSLPAVFSDHMVLQRQSEVIIWGWASPLEAVTVVGSWDGKAVRDTADNNANWQVTVQTPAAGGPHTLTVMGDNTIVLEDIMIGEVWLCSGQSNMEWSAAAGIDSAPASVLNAENPSIRLFQVAKRAAAAPQLDAGGTWEPCSPSTMRSFSAVAYFFGQRLYEELGIPIGLIHSSWGGTPAEAWMPPVAVAADQAFANAAARRGQLPWCPVEPGSAYHAMIAPLIPYQLAGFIWYQGETNTTDPELYEQLFPAMIESWREQWKQQLPFYYVQIAPYEYNEAEIGVRLRESQRHSLRTPKTGMVVISDIGNIDDIHPRNKKDVGRRLAGWALNRTYGMEHIPHSGPLYREMKIEGDQVRLFFDHTEGGLVCRGDKLTHFEIAGENGKFVPAEASIDGKTVVVKATGVQTPTAVRFAWSNTAEPNLFNEAGLPASCFRTDD